MLVRDPDRGGQTTLIAEVLLSHYKGIDNNPKPLVDTSLPRPFLAHYL
jgi:hypothetical protein